MLDWSTSRKRIPLALPGLLALFVVISPASPALQTAGPSSGLASVDLDVRGVGYPVYRIPALTRTNAGTLIAAYDGRPGDPDVPSNIALVLRRSTDGGATWGARQVVRYEPGAAGFGDPSLLVDRTTGRIFLFYVGAVNTGFHQSATGNDEDDPNVLQMDYSYSDDDGVTWRHERITREAKQPAWAGLFPASGEGIQIRRGRYAGRLLQQYVIRHEGDIWAASLYSDDHGKRWRFGALVGPGMDENKTVELSDGTILLNSRAPGGVRKVAWSTDGGFTYAGLRQEPTLVDPANNGSIIRRDLEAPPNSPTARQLLFSNTNHPSQRRNLTITMSCDDGETWPVRRTIEAGPSAYSTLTPLGDGRFGLLYEAADASGRVTAIRFVVLDRAWLGADCTVD